MQSWAIHSRFELLAHAAAEVLLAEARKHGRGSSADSAAAGDLFAFAADLCDARDFARDGLLREQREVFHACHFLGNQPMEQSWAMALSPPSVFEPALEEARAMERRDTDDYRAKRGRWATAETMRQWANGLPV